MDKTLNAPKKAHQPEVDELATQQTLAQRCANDIRRRFHRNLNGEGNPSSDENGALATIGDRSFNAALTVHVLGETGTKTTPLELAIMYADVDVCKAPLGHHSLQYGNPNASDNPLHIKRRLTQ